MQIKTFNNKEEVHALWRQYAPGATAGRLVESVVKLLGPARYVLHGVPLSVISSDDHKAVQQELTQRSTQVTVIRADGKVFVPSASIVFSGQVGSPDQKSRVGDYHAAEINLQQLYAATPMQLLLVPYRMLYVDGYFDSGEWRRRVRQAVFAPNKGAFKPYPIKLRNKHAT